jgi:hypothetical protein
MMASNRERIALAEGIIVGRIRGIQSFHYKAHKALVNWGYWSLDRADIYPRLKPPSVWDQFKRDENDAYGEEQAPAVSVERAPVRAERADKPKYDERLAIALDERLHGYGCPSVEVRQCLKAAYVTREVPETQFPKLCGITEDAFCERLETALLFVALHLPK